MAALLELREIFNCSALRNKVVVALAKKAYAVVGEDDSTTNHANRLAYAFQIIDAPESEGRPIFYAVIMANASLSQSSIEGASDSAVENNISDDLYNEFADSAAGE